MIDLFYSLHLRLFFPNCILNLNRGSSPLYPFKIFEIVKENYTYDIAKINKPGRGN